MLASLLPGLRDLRAPLAAGYLWLAAGWLYFAPRLPASVNDAHGVLKDIYRVVDVSSPVAVGVGLTFVAYMVGMLSTGLLTAPVRGMVSSILAVVRVVALFIVALLPFFIGWVADRLFSSPEEDYNVIDKLGVWADRVGRKFSRAPITRAEKLVTRRISDKVLRDPDYRKWILGHLEDWNLHEFVRQTRKRRIYTRYELVMDDPTLEKEKRLIKIREILSEDLGPGADEYAEALVRSVVEVHRHASDLLDELTLVPERIVGDKPATYERWDRLSAEGDFRQGIVPPLIAIIAVLMVRGVLNWPSGLLAAVLPLAILYQGIGKEYAAQAQLMQTIEADVIQIDLLERLTAHNLYWWNP